MAKPIYDPDSHLRNYCIVSRAVCEVFPRAVTNEIYQYTTPFALEEMINKEFLSWIPMSKDQTEEASCSVKEHPPSLTENFSFTTLCHILQSFQSRHPSLKHINVSPHQLNEMKTLLKELYVFEDRRMIPKKEFQTLWKKVKLISRMLDKACLPKLIPYHQQTKNIKMNYRYGQEEDICRGMKEQWDRETESLKEEVIKLRYLYKETTSVRNKFASIHQTLVNSLKCFYKRSTRIRLSTYNGEESSLCVSCTNREAANNDQLQVCVSLLHDRDNDIKPLEDSGRDFQNSLFSESTFQPTVIESGYIIANMDNLDIDHPTEFNALLNDGSSILEMDVADDDKHTTLEKHTGGENVHQTLAADGSLKDEITNQHQSKMDTEKSPDAMFPGNLSSKGESTENSQSDHGIEREVCQVSCFDELQLSKKFGSEHEFRKESHCPGPPDKEAGTIYSKSGFSTSHIPTELSHFTNFVASSVAPPFSDPRSFLWSSSEVSELSSFLRPTSSIHESSFGDLRCKTNTVYVDKMNSLVSSIQSSSQGLLFALNNDKGQEAVLMLNCKLISQSVSIVNEDTGSAASSSTAGQSREDQFEKCSEAHCRSNEDSLIRPHGQRDKKTLQFKTELVSSREDNGASPECSVNTRQKYVCKREKEELKKKLMKYLYSSIWKGKVSKKKYHQAIRRASLRCLMDKFFKNFNQFSKKDKNELSKIINHYMNLLAFSGSRSLLTYSRSSPNFPVGRSTPSRLETFFQDLVESEDVAAADTMHVEWMRLRTFWSFPTNTNVSTVQLARDGFYYTGHTTETRCFCCRNVYREWNETSDINAIHRRLSPNCDMANGRSARNFAIHAQHGGINILERVNPETPASEQNRTPAQDEVPTTQQNIGQNLTPAHQDEVLTTQQNTGQNQTPARQDEVLTTQQNTRPSVSDEEEDQFSAEAAQNSMGNETGRQSAAQSPKPSKSKLKRDKKKKKKELANSNQSTTGPLGGLVVTEVPQTVESSNATPISSATPSTEREADAASNATTNAREKTLAAATNTTETPRTGGLQIEEVQHHSAQPPSDKSQQRTSSPSSIPRSSASISTYTGRSPRSQPRQGGGGANPPAPSQGRANPPGPTSAERLAQLDPLGINFDKPKYPSYAVYSTRHSSFEGWPSHMAQTPREMARAGYYYAGYGDYARCFFCGGGLRNWDRNDDPWIEHARWFPRCAFLRNNKGDKYVARVQRRHQEQEAGLVPSSQLPSPIDRDLDTSIAQALREMGYHNPIIQRAMNKWRANLIPGRRHPPPMTAACILDIIEKIQNTDQVQAAQSERPLSIPGMQNMSVADESPQSSQPLVAGTSDSPTALEENRTDSDTVPGQPRDYGYTQRETQEKKILQEDFLGLTETLVCKVCCDKDVAAAFLPCGHLVCCLDCAPAMRKCPLCDELIKGTVKTYFS